MPTTSAPRTDTACVYRWYDAAGVLLYVGITNDLDTRTYGHTMQGTGWMRYAVRCEATEQMPRADAEVMERETIKAERPVFNYTHAGGYGDRVRMYLDPTAKPYQRDLTTGQVAATLGISPYHVKNSQLDYWLTPGGDAPKPRRHRRYRRQDVERYAREVLGRELEG